MNSVSEIKSALDKTKFNIEDCINHIYTICHFRNNDSVEEIENDIKEASINVIRLIDRMTELSKLYYIRDDCDNKIKKLIEQIENTDNPWE